MKVLNFKDFMKKYNFKKDTMNGSDLQKNYNCPIYPRDAEIYYDKGFVNIDDGRKGGSHWTAFYVEKNHTTLTPLVVNLIIFFKQLPKPVIYHNYKIHGINSKSCGSYCLYFFYLIERMNHYDAILKLVFE